MNQTKENLQPAFLISSINYRETSVIGVFFTLDQGLISLVVRGVRKPKSKIFLQPFTPLLLNFFGKGELKTCGKLEVAANPIWLTGDALASGWYMNELLQRLVPQGVAMQKLFRAYSVFMPYLAEKSKMLMALREFELQLLTTIGINPHFKTQTGEDLSPEINYTFVNEQGFLPNSQINQQINSTNQKQANISFLGEDLIAIKNKNWNKTSLSACKKLNSFFINPLLGDKPLQSRKLLVR